MLTGFILLVLFLISAHNIYAADISHSVQKTDYNVADEIEFDVTLSINSANGKEYFLRGVFFKPGDNNYCGYTWNGSSFFSGPYSTNEGWKSFLKISVTDNTWSGKLKSKIDPEDNGCAQSGEYHFKIQRFTGSGAGTFDNQTESVLHFTIPTPTPTPQPTETPTSTPNPVKIPTHISTSKKESNITLRVTLTDEENVALTKNILSGKEVYSANSKITPTKKQAKRGVTQQSVKGKDTERDLGIHKGENVKKKGGNIFVYLGGGSLLTCCGILLFRAYRKRNEE